MPVSVTEKEMLLIQKATVYDLARILKKEPKKTYSVEEMDQIFDAYIDGAESAVKGGH